MHPNHATRYSQRITSVSDLVRATHPPYADPIRKNSSHSPRQPVPLWGSSSNPAEHHPAPTPRVQPLTRNHQPPQQSQPRQVANNSTPLWRAPESRKTDEVNTLYRSHSTNHFDNNIERFAKLLTPFIYKLYRLVSDNTTNDLCGWLHAGTAFVIHDQVTFSAKVLPQYFKHNQFSSFVRQLNKYSFYKLASGSCIFGHIHFQKDCPSLLLHIAPPRPHDRYGEKNRPSSVGVSSASLGTLQNDTAIIKPQYERGSDGSPSTVPTRDHKENEAIRACGRTVRCQHKRDSDGSPSTAPKRDHKENEAIRAYGRTVRCQHERDSDGSPSTAPTRDRKTNEVNRAYRRTVRRQHERTSGGSPSTVPTIDFRTNEVNRAYGRTVRHQHERDSGGSPNTVPTGDIKTNGVTQPYGTTAVHQHKRYSDVSASTVPTGDLKINGVKQTDGRTVCPNYHSPSLSGDVPLSPRQHPTSPSKLCIGNSLHNDFPKSEPIRVGHSDRVALEKLSMDDLEHFFRHIKKRITDDLHRDMSLAKNEREELLHRLCAAEQKNEELTRELHNCYRRIEGLERREKHFVGHKRVLDTSKETIVIDGKRRRG